MLISRKKDGQNSNDAKKDEQIKPTQNVSCERGGWNKKYETQNEYVAANGYKNA